MAGRAKKWRGWLERYSVKGLKPAEGRRRVGREVESKETLASRDLKVGTKKFKALVDTEPSPWAGSFTHGGGKTYQQTDFI